MTTDPKEFFKDNVNRIDARKEPILYNMNCGFLALCRQIEALAANQRELDQTLRTIARTLQYR